MPEPMTNQAYQAAAAALLTTWEIACVRPKDSPALNGDVVNLYALALHRIRATQEEIKEVSLNLPMRSKWFPSLQECVAGIEEVRADLETKRKQEQWAAMVPCIDLHGQNGTAPYYRVLDGRELPLGETNPRAVHPRESAALATSSAPALPAPMSDEARRAAVLELAERNPDAAGAFVAVLAMGEGSKEERMERTRVEREALREFKDANPEAGQESRVRTQKEPLVLTPEEEARLIQQAQETRETRAADAVRGGA